MKLSFLICMTAVLSLSANSYSQTKQLSLNKNDASIAEIFSEIEARSEFSFLFSPREIDVDQKVSISGKNMLITDILASVLSGKNIAYQITDRHIILYKADATMGLALQGVTVTGTITDITGMPMPGVNVVIKGTTTGVISDFNGKYSITVPNKESILIFSFVGYVTSEFTTGDMTRIDIVMDEDTQEIEEVIVVGYGTQRKSDLTGSVGTVSTDKLKERPVSNFGEALIGQIAGVQIQQTNGSPGGEGLTVRVRGTGSITQSNDPLYVVDGYPMEGGAFSLINSSDIESIQILKDASSTAIYGSRGANGVVIISTKKGKTGAPSVSLNAYVGIQQREKKIEMMNRDQYVEWFKDGRNQSWLDQPVIAADPDQSPHTIYDSNARRKLYSSANSLYMIPDGTDGWLYDFNNPASVAQMPDTDWQDELFRTALQQQYELSIYGGSEKTKYAFSGSYMNQDGIMICTDYQRFNFRTNISSQLNKYLEVGVNLNAYYGNGNEQADGKDAPIMYALSLPPIYPVRNADGTYGSMVRNPEILAGDVSSPIGIAENRSVYRKRYGWLGTIFGEVTFFDGLKYRININGSVRDNNRYIYEPSTMDKDASKAPRPAMGSNEQKTDFDWVIEQTLTYNATFAQKHNLTLLGGYTTQKHTYERAYGESRTFANDLIHTLNAGTMYQLTTEESAYSMISYLARANYVYDNRYMFTATVRTDGSSRFGENNRWGTFPSASIGWRINQESFMRDVKAISDLKLRASYGIVGNNRIGNYSAIGLLSTGFYPTGNALQNTVGPKTMENKSLSWEKTQQVNLGFDLALFNNRIRVEADFYDSRSLDLLLDVPVPTITGYSTQMQNVGKVQNKGMEFLVSTKNLVNEFKWSSDFNISFNKNKVLEVGPEGRPIYGSVPNASNSFITMPGHPVASFYGYQYEGVFMSEAELNQYPHLAVDKVGDGRYLDANNDKVMDSKDQVILGDNNPIFVAGLNNHFSYKNFSLNLQLTGSYGADLFSFFKRMVGIYHGDRNGMAEQLGRWRSPDEPGDGTHFRATRNPSGWQRTPSSAWVTDGSYLRIRNLTIAYDIDPTLLERVKIKGARVYVTGQNLYTWTNYPGYDPETSSEGDNSISEKNGLTKGGDYLGYPAARSFILGVNINF